MNETLWGAVGAGVGAGLTGFFNWLYQVRREKKDLQKAQAEIDSSEIDNVEKAIAIWRKLAEEMNSQVVQLQAQVKMLGEEVSSLRVENATLKAQVDELRQENTVLRNEVHNIQIKQ